MHTITRRGLLGLTAGAAAAGVLGCSKSSTSDGATSTYAPADKDHEAELRYGIWDTAQVPTMKKIIGAFNQKYPNIKVKLDVTPFDSYWTKLQTEATSDTMPDVFWMNPLNFQIYAAGNKLMPATPMIKSGAIEKSNYVEAAWDIYDFEGTHYGVPKDNDAMAIWYNKKILAQYGLDEPQAPWTWADLQAMLKKLAQKSKGKMFGLTGPVDSHGNHSWYNSVYQAGGYILSDDRQTCGYDQPGTVEGVRFWADLIADKYTPSIKQLTDTPFATWFTSGRAAMAGDGSWQSNPFHEALKDDLGVVPWPTGAKGNPVCVSGSSNVIPAKVKDPQAAMTFLEFLGGKAAAVIQAEGGIVIPAFKGSQDAYYDSIPGLDLGIFEKAIGGGFSNPATKNTQAWQKVELDTLLPVFQGKAEVESTCQGLYTKINTLLANE